MIKRKRRRSREFKDTSRIIDMEEARKERRQKRETAAKKPRGTKRKRQNSARTEARAAKKAKKRLIYTAIFIGMIAVIGVSAYNLLSLKMQQKDLEEKQALLEKQRTKLEYELSQVDTPEYVEQQARQMLRMIKPGEILYIMPEKTKSSTQSAIIPEE